MEQLSTFTLADIVKATQNRTGNFTIDSALGIDRDLLTESGEWIDNPEWQRAIELETLVKSLRYAGVPERYLALGWEDLEIVEPLAAIRAGCERITDIVRAGHSLILCGPAGAGKTQSAMLVARAAVEHGYTIAVANLGRLAARIRAAYSEDDGTTEHYEAQRLAEKDVLVLDDVGAGESGEAKVERRLLYFVLEERQNARRPTVITTNLTAAGLKDFLGDRLMNRLMPAEVLNFKHGKNFRLPKEKTLWAPGGPA